MTNEPGFPPSALWQNDFTVDNLIDYARASKALSDYVRVLVRDGYTSFVVPSRGAVPFISAASTAWRLDARALPTFEARFKEVGELTASPFHRKLVLPFTLPPEEIAQFMREAERAQAAGLDVLDDDWFRPLKI